MEWIPIEKKIYGSGKGYLFHFNIKSQEEAEEHINCGVFWFKQTVVDTSVALGTTTAK